MVIVTSFILSLVLLGMGILGSTGVLPIFTSSSIFINIGEIVLGILGFLASIFGLRRMSRKNRRERQRSEQIQANFEQWRKEYEQLRVENSLQVKDSFDLQRKDYEQLREEKKHLQEDYERLREENKHLHEENKQQIRDNEPPEKIPDKQKQTLLNRLKKKIRRQRKEIK